MRLAAAKRHGSNCQYLCHHDARLVAAFQAASTQRRLPRTGSAPHHTFIPARPTRPRALPSLLVLHTMTRPHPTCVSSTGALTMVRTADGSGSADWLAGGGVASATISGSSVTLPQRPPSTEQRRVSGQVRSTPLLLRAQGSNTCTVRVIWAGSWVVGGGKSERGHSKRGVLGTGEGVRVVVSQLGTLAGAVREAILCEGSGGAVRRLL